VRQTRAQQSSAPTCHARCPRKFAALRETLLYAGSLPEGWPYTVINRSHMPVCFNMIVSLPKYGGDWCWFYPLYVGICPPLSPHCPAEIPRLCKACPGYQRPVDRQSGDTQTPPYLGGHAPATDRYWLQRASPPAHDSGRVKTVDNRASYPQGESTPAHRRFRAMWESRGKSLGGATSTPATYTGQRLR